MITFTQKGELLTSDNGKIGNQYSDITVKVNLSDDTFAEFDYVGLYVADPVRSQYVFPYKITDGLCTIGHEAVSGMGDVRVCVAGYNVDGGQLTTNAIPLIVRQSNNPAGSTSETSDWKSAMAQAMAEACISNERYLAAQAEALAETAAAREAMATAGADYAREHGIAVPTVINNLTTNSSAAALSAAQGKILKELIDDKDKKPTSGSTKAAESGGIYDALAALAESAETGSNWAPVGNLNIAAGTLSLTGLDIMTEAEGNYYGVADVGGKSSLFAEKGFPCCFTSTPTVWMFPTGSESTMWCGRSGGETAGLRSAAIFRGKQKENSTFTGRYIVIGRNDGARKQGADVITQGLAYIGKACGSEIVALYNAFADNQQDDDAAWCSEFASVCANKAGISTDIFPYFASAYKGSGKFSDLGMLYVLNGSSFTKATVTNSSKSNYAYTLGTETYVPQLGDVLFLTTLDDDDTPASAPNHTALITSVGTVDGQTVLYTLEGNQSNTAGDRTVQRRTRTIGGSQKRDQAIFAIGRVNYAANTGGSRAIAAGQAIRSNNGDSGAGTSVEIDTTLTKSGAAADAAAAGAALKKKANTTDIPTALKNPCALTLTGAVTGTYDGSEAMTVNIPTSSGSGGLVVQIAGSSSDTSVADIKAVYDKGQAVYVYSVDDDCYATLQAATSSTAVFVSVDTSSVRVITVDTSNDVTVSTKALSGEASAAKSTFFGTSLTQGLTAAKTATVDGDFSLSTGVVALIKFAYVSAATSPTLNVNSTGAKPILRLDGTADVAYMWAQGEVVPLIYDGTSWLIIAGGKATTGTYGMAKLISGTDSASETEAATPKAVSDALAAAKAYADKLIGDVENGAY